MIDKSKIVRVYSGRDGKCCCGCAGKYWEDPKGIARVVNKMNKLLDQVKDDVGHVYLVVNNRLYIAYYE